MDEFIPEQQPQQPEQQPPQQPPQQPNPVYQPPQQPPYYQPPQQYQYQVPVNGQQASPNGLSVAALVCGILGIVLCWIPYVCYFALILSICGVIFGALGMKKAAPGTSGRGMSIAGLVCGIVSLGITLLVVVCTAAVLCSAASALDSWSYYSNF